MTDTWGISGPTFLLAYVVIALAAWIATARARRTLARGPQPESSTSGLSTRPHDVAYLNGGPDLAIFSALSALHLREAITSSRGTITATGRLDHGADGLERAIHFASTSPVHRKRLPSHRTVAEALAAIEARLVGAGLLLSDRQRLQIRRVGFWLLAVAALGFVRILAGIAGAKPVGFLIIATLAVTAIAVWQLARAPRRTHRGNVALTDMRTEHHDLAPSAHPDWALYGADAAALGIAIYGMSALWASDPALANELEAQRVASGGSGSSSGGDGGGSCGGGGGCGGGGCGCGGGGCGG